MKLVFLIPTMGSGGAERVMSILVDYFAIKGYEVHLFIFDKDPSFYKINSNVHCHYIYTERKIGGPIGTLMQLRASFLSARALIKQIKPDCLIGFTTVYNVLTILLAKSEKVPSIISERTNPKVFKVTKITGLLRKWFYRFGDAIVLQTERSISSFKESGIQIPQRKEIIFNPIGGEFSNQCLVRENIILSVGRIDSKKGHDLLLKAWAKSQPYGWKLWIAGEGVNKEMYIKLAQDLQINSQVEFLGNVKDVNALLNRAKIFVLSSRVEGFPNALCEAMLAGCACISFDCPTGPAEIIQDGQNGRLVDAENIDKLAEAIKELTLDDVMQKRMASQAVLLKNDLDKNTIGKKWEHLLKSLIVNKNTQ